MSGAEAGMKNSSQNIFENYFESNYPPLPLPMIWRVVYHEAVRGNHILWDRVDLDAIEEHVQSSNFTLDTEDKKVATRFMSKFFSTVDYTDLQTMLKRLTLAQKSLVFLLYRRSMTGWQQWLKRNLH
ncbi:MAG: hypothetical protein NTV34_10815 [Proteobacteria bacterium]|nr:hypothetical protein [Pseudomonadota bacterium]